MIYICEENIHKLMLDMKHIRVRHVKFTTSGWNNM